jgi:diadenosine tetraphosphate (Ap4A) HIT family hydrolase
MKKMEKCVFCDKNKDPQDTIFETENFFVKIGLGLAAPGHVMLIPKDHFLCYADMPVVSRNEFMELKDLVFEKVKAAFGAPFLAEYGPRLQSVTHAHLHFIPKQRKETKDYAGYKIENIFDEMEIPNELIIGSASWKRAVELRQTYGQYVFLQDGDRACLYSENSPEPVLLKKLNCRRFFGDKLKIKDIPVHWQNITQEQLRLDAIKKQTTKSLLSF